MEPHPSDSRGDPNIRKHRRVLLTPILSEPPSKLHQGTNRNQSLLQIDNSNSKSKLLFQRTSGVEGSVLHRHMQRPNWSWPTHSLYPFGVCRLRFQSHRALLCSTLCSTISSGLLYYIPNTKYTTPYFIPLDPPHRYHYEKLASG